MKHIHYRDGIAHLFTTIDGNNKSLLLALALCESESIATWEWFGKQCIKFGLGRYLSLPDSSVIGDRMKGIERFIGQFPTVNHLSCFRHIIDNIYRHTRGRVKGITVHDLWRLRNAKTFPEWYALFVKIGNVSFKMSEYIGERIKPERVWRHELLSKKVVTFGRSTSQLAESEMCWAHS